MHIKLSHVAAGFIAVLVGYASSVAIIFQAIEQLGATQAQANSWMLMMGVGMGVSTLLLTLYTRAPMLTAWSTPGAALIALSTDIPLPEAIGAFLFCAVLLVLTGLSGWADRLTRLIPETLANAMLAGILFSFGMKIFDSAQADPLLVAVLGLSDLACRRIIPRYAIIVVFALGLAYVASTQGLLLGDLQFSIARPVFVMPDYSLSALIGLGLPLYIVTMSAQNLPGLVTLRANGYEPRTRSALSVTGGISLLLAPYGGFAFGLAAITAAICAGPDADEAPTTRYKAAAIAGVLCLGLGLLGATVIGLFVILPPALVLSIAALALLGTIGNSLSAALSDPNDRDAALVTFMTTVSGLSVLGIAPPFWALVLGVVTRLWLHPNARGWNFRA
jgi:benzoate membrane transport protein